MKLLPTPQLIRPYNPHDVTSRDGQHEHDPASVGLSSHAVESIWQRVIDLYNTRTQPAIALCLIKDGHVLIDRAIGHLSGNLPNPYEPPNTPLRPATPSSLYNIFSASKAITAMLVHLANERGLLHLDDPVCHYLPNFASHNKHHITIRHLLLHRAGIPTLPQSNIDLNDLSLLHDTPRILSLLYNTQPLYTPGRRLAYHALTGGWILAEVLRTVTQNTISQLLQDSFSTPLNLQHMRYGTTPDNLHNVARNAYTGPPIPTPLQFLAKRALGVPFERAVQLSNSDDFLTSVVPAGNILTTPHDAARLYWTFLQNSSHNNHPNTPRILQPRTMHRARAEQSHLTPDLILTVPIRYSMGFILGRRSLSLYGNNTPNAFGHLGLTAVFTWADPDRNIAACLATTGKPLLTLRLRNLYNILSTISNNIPPTQ